MPASSRSSSRRSSSPDRVRVTNHPTAAVELTPHSNNTDLLLVPVDGAHDIAGARVPQPEGRVSRSGDQQRSVRVPLHALDVVLVSEQRQLGLASTHRPDVDLAVVAAGWVTTESIPLGEWTEMDIAYLHETSLESRGEKSSPRTTYIDTTNKLSVFRWMHWIAVTGAGVRVFDDEDVLERFVAVLDETPLVSRHQVVAEPLQSHSCGNNGDKKALPSRGSVDLTGD